MRVKATAIQLPQRQRAPSPSITVGKGMNRLKSVMQDCRTQHGRKLQRLRVPPRQQLKHQARHRIRGRRQIVADAHAHRAVSARFALIHHLTGQNTVQFQHVILPNRLNGCVVFHIAQPGETIHHLALRPPARARQLAAFFQRAHLLQRQRIALDRGGRMHIARPGILLKRRNPRQIDRCALNALTQRRHPFNLVEQCRADAEMRNVSHGQRLSKRQV